MATHKSSGELDINSPADEFTERFTREEIRASKLFHAKDLRFKIVSKDLEKGTVTISVVGNLVSESFKSVKATFTITPPKEDTKPNRMEWIVESEKISTDIKDPVWISDALIGYIKSLGFLDKVRQ